MLFYIHVLSQFVQFLATREIGLTFCFAVLVVILRSQAHNPDYTLISNYLSVLSQSVSYFKYKLSAEDAEAEEKIQISQYNRESASF